MAHQLDQPDDRHIVESTVPGGLIIDQMKASVGALDRKRFFADPAADRCTQIVNRPRRIVVRPASVGKAVQNYSQRVTSPPLTLRKGIIVIERPVVPSWLTPWVMVT